MTTSDWPLGALWLIVVLAVAVKLFCAWHEDRADLAPPPPRRIWRRRPHHQRRRRRAAA